MALSKISLASRIILSIAALLFFCSLLFPIWQIDLEAPQYPEGLGLKLYAHKIGGDVKIINGLNHYIGMKTLHTENFPEFAILPYIIIFFGLATFIMVFFYHKKSMTLLLSSFLLFVLLAGLDFYRWNYNYGHNLDPNAAIQIPGMTYQPPLIGYKQLLNFSAFSIPDTGGWMLLVAGVLLGLIVIKETQIMDKFKKKFRNTAMILFLSTILLSCKPPEPKPIKIHYDSCDFCKMTISDSHFGAQVLTAKGRYYNFDDISCLVRYVKANPQLKYRSFYINDYLRENILIPAESCFYLQGGSISSPMRGNIAAFHNSEEAETYLEKLSARRRTWKQIFESDP